MPESKNDRRICFYHNDLDGHCAGAIVAKNFDWDIELIPINYNDPFPWDKINKETEVWMVDFCLQPFSDMVKLKEECKRLTWIDHHETALNEYQKYTKDKHSFQGIRSLVLSGCELTYIYFDGRTKHAGWPKDPTEQVDNLAVSLLGRYDVWKWKDVPNALEFQFGMRLLETHPGKEKGRELWKILLGSQRASERCIDKIVEEGRVVLRYREQQNKKQALGSCFQVEMNGHKFIVANVGYTNSQFFDSVIDKFPEAVGVMSFHYRKKCWNISLYEIKGRECPDMGELAVMYGGGGHKGAAGFQVPNKSMRIMPFRLPFNYGL